MSAIAFRKELEKLINCESMENGSDTPDFMLADYLVDCLAAFDKAVNTREKRYGRGPKLTGQPPIDNDHVADGCEQFSDDVVRRNGEAV